MTSKMRSTVGRTAAGMGALALLLGAAACTGGEDEAPAGPGATTEQDAPAGGSEDEPSEAEPSEDAAPAPSDGGGERSSSPFTDAELDAASQRFLDVLQVLDDQDWEAACGAVLDPTTGTAPEGERLQECVDGVEPALADHADMLQPGTFDAIDLSMIEARDNGDGTVSVSVLGEELDIPMTQGDDGQWYFSIPF